MVLRDPFLSKTARQAALLGLAVHQLAVLSNLYFVRLPGTGSDSVVFLRKAKEALASGINWGNFVGTGADFYKNGLALLFKVAGPSDFAAFETTILGFSLVLLTTARLVRSCGYESATPKVLAIVSLLPTSIAYGSTTLREVWQQLFFVVSCWMIVELQGQFKSARLGKLILALVFLGCLQKGLMVYAALLLIIGGYFASGTISKSKGKRKKTDPFFIVVQIVILAGIAMTANWALTNGGKTSAVADAVSEGNILDYASNYRELLDESRASYGGALDTTSVNSLIISAVSLAFLFQFSPLPWQISETIDLISFGEIVVRSLLAFGGAIAFRRIPREHRKKFQFLWIAFLLLDAMWAMGTANWGTAARHRTVGLPVLCALGAPFLAKSTEQSQAGEPQEISVRERIRQRRRGSQAKRVRDLQRSNTNFLD